MREQAVTATLTTNEIRASREATQGQFDVHITVEKLGESMPALIFDEFTKYLKMADGASDIRIYSAIINNSGTPTVGSQDGSWIDSVDDSGVGRPTLNFPAGTFSAIPRCACTTIASSRNCSVFEGGGSSTFIPFQTTDLSGTVADVDIQVICMGQ